MDVHQTISHNCLWFKKQAGPLSTPQPPRLFSLSCFTKRSKKQNKKHLVVLLLAVMLRAVKAAFWRNWRGAGNISFSFFHFASFIIWTALILLQSCCALVAKSILLSFFFNIHSFLFQLLVMHFGLLRDVTWMISDLICLVGEHSGGSKESCADWCLRSCCSWQRGAKALMASSAAELQLQLARRWCTSCVVMRLVGVVWRKENSSDMKLEQQGLRIILSYRGWDLWRRRCCWVLCFGCLEHHKLSAI